MANILDICPRIGCEWNFMFGAEYLINWHHCEQITGSTFFRRNQNSSQQVLWILKVMETLFLQRSKHSGYMVAFMHQTAVYLLLEMRLMRGAWKFTARKNRNNELKEVTMLYIPGRQGKVRSIPINLGDLFHNLESFDQLLIYKCW